jgi:hypothetical protein
MGLAGVRVTKNFMKSFDAAIAPLQGCIEGAVHDFVRSFRANPTRCLQSYDRVSGREGGFLEIDVAGGPRLIAALREDVLYLLDTGDHEITKRWAGRRMPKLSDAEPAPPQFLPESPAGFFSRVPNKGRSHFANEFDPEWLYFLDAQQAEVLRAILDRVQDGLLGRGVGVCWIVGGPGTGKTCLLLNLLKWAVDAKLKVSIRLSPPVADYIQRSLGKDLGDVADVSVADPTDAGDGDDLDLLLIDDPSTLRAMRSGMDRVAGRTVRFVVVGFDPLQMRESLTDDEFSELSREYDVSVLRLRTCYRQKENVGRASAKVADAIAASTPFLAHDKIERYRNDREELTSLANQLRFPNPKGYVDVYLGATEDDVAREVRRILGGDPLWRHWPPLLVVFDEGLSLPGGWKRAWSQVRCVEAGLNSLERLKGIECQHCFMIIGRDLYEAVERGFKGSGQSVYNERRLLRIPFSRAKDSIVTFVVDGAAVG